MIKIYQNITKSGAKKGELYYTCKADQSGTLNIVSGKYSLKEDKDKKQIGILSASVAPSTEGELEVLHFVDGKVQPTQPFDWPITIHIKCNFTDGSPQEKAIHKLFTANNVKINDVSGADLAKGFAGEISYADTPGVKRIASGEGIKEHDWQSFADIVVQDCTISDTEIPGISGNSYGGKGQTEAEKIADRLAYMAKACTAEFPEGVQLAQLSKDLAIEPYMVIQILFS